jgi:hypothetical protein
VLGLWVLVTYLVRHMLVNVVDSRREGAISSILVHHVYVPARRAFTEKREGSEGGERATSLKEVLSRMILHCKPPHNPAYRLVQDRFLSKMSANISPKRSILVPFAQVC